MCMPDKSLCILHPFECPQKPKDMRFLQKFAPPCRYWELSLGLLWEQRLLWLVITPCTFLHQPVVQKMAWWHPCVVFRYRFWPASQPSEHWMCSWDRHPYLHSGWNRPHIGWSSVPVHLLFTQKETRALREGWAGKPVTSRWAHGPFSTGPVLCWTAYGEVGPYFLLVGLCFNLTGRNLVIFSFPESFHKIIFCLEPWFKLYRK